MQSIYEEIRNVKDFVIARGCKELENKTYRERYKSLNKFIFSFNIIIIEEDFYKEYRRMPIVQRKLK